MEFKADLGKLKDGRNAVLIEKGGRFEFILASGFDPTQRIGRMWSAGTYYYSLEDFCKAVIDANKEFVMAKVNWDITKEDIENLIADGLSNQAKSHLSISPYEYETMEIDERIDYVENEIRHNRLNINDLFGLSDEIAIPSDVIDHYANECETEDEILDCLADWVSDEYGFCHKGISVEGLDEYLEDNDFDLD